MKLMAGESGCATRPGAACSFLLSSTVIVNLEIQLETAFIAPLDTGEEKRKEQGAINAPPSLTLRAGNFDLSVLGKKIPGRKCKLYPIPGVCIPESLYPRKSVPGVLGAPLPSRALRRRRAANGRSMTRTYDRSDRPQRSRKASGARGWYDSPEWRQRSKAHLARNPYCVRCPAVAQLCDHIQPTRPGEPGGVLRGPIQSMCRSYDSANTMHCTANVFVTITPAPPARCCDKRPNQADPQGGRMQVTALRLSSPAPGPACDGVSSS